MAFDYTVPLYIKARTADELTLEMARNNRKHGFNLRYFDIQHVEGRWFAWYYLDNSAVMKQRVNKLFGDEKKRLIDGE